MCHALATIVDILLDVVDALFSLRCQQRFLRDRLAKSPVSQPRTFRNNTGNILESGASIWYHLKMAASKLSASHTHEVFTHTAFDRDYLNIRNPGLLPASARRKFLLSIRTAYTVMLCIALTYYLDFGQSGSYLAPIYSAISGGSLYVGQWQGDMWRAIYSALICGGIGVFIGLFTWHIIPLQLILQFIALTWMNRISSWDRLPKVIGGVSIILGVLWPSTSSGVLSGAKAFSYIIEIHYIPYIITGLTLFFPYVSLATFAAQKKVDDICNKLNSATVALTRAFCATDYVDLYNAQINQLLLNVRFLQLSFGFFVCCTYYL